MQPQIVPAFNIRRRRLRLTVVLPGLALAWLGCGGAVMPAAAQIPAIEIPAATQAVPGFWDPRRHPERPDLSRLTLIRFLTETDYPPFNFAGPDGNPAGFNVDFARMICEEIKVSCTIQMRRFEMLADAVATNRGDAVIASYALLAATGALTLETATGRQ